MAVSPAPRPIPDHRRRDRLWAATMHGHGPAARPRSPGPRRVAADHRPRSGRGPRAEREAAEQRPAGARRPPGPTGPAGGPWPRRPTRCAPASSATVTASCTRAAFRRLAGKTQVFVFPADHQRTRLTHALEVAQVATAIADALGLNRALTEAIALGHDCGHGPGRPRQRGRVHPLPARGLRPRRVGRRRGAGPAQPVRRDARRRPQPLVVPAPAGHARGRGRGLGRPHRLRLPRLRGRGLGRHRGPRRPARRWCASAAATGAAPRSPQFIAGVVSATTAQRLDRR